MQDEFNDPLWRQVLSGAQMLFVAFGALVLIVSVSTTLGDTWSGRKGAVQQCHW